ncbi:MAG: glycoside hydrolase family 25 [Oscillospiraceae bacterium]|nr:glycoside hydrolase family 25 [Oscillospiraceae bacterium]
MLDKKHITIGLICSVILTSCTQEIPPAPDMTDSAVITEGTAAEETVTEIQEETTAASRTSQTTETSAPVPETVSETSDTDIQEKTSETSAETTSVTSATHAAEDMLSGLSSPPPQVLPAPAKHYDKVFEVYSELYAHDLAPEDAEMTDDYEIDTSSAGDFSAELKYVLDGEEKSETVYFSVADTQPPVLLNSGWDINIKTGKDFDISKWVGVGDYYDDNITLSYTGELDTETEGKYPLTAVACDSSGNRTEWDITVNVVDTLPSSDYDDGDKLPFDEFIRDYGGEGTLGIDVSKWQGDIDFEKVRAAGCEFVIMRIGKDTDGIQADEKFDRNFKAAKDAGLRVGVYFYSCANSEDEIRADAKWIAEKLDGAGLDFPVAFDWESFSTYQNYHMSIHRLNELYKLFDRSMNSYGYDTMLYSSKNFLLNFWQTDKTVWLAHYTDRTNYTGRYELWQLSSTGRIDGIYGAVDLDIWYE